MHNHIVCYSGGHSSAIVAIEVARKFPNDNVILLNHNINPNVENSDIKRFKQQVSQYLNLPITYDNYGVVDSDHKLPDQFDVAIERQAFKVRNGSELCTWALKTNPFDSFLKTNFPVQHDQVRDDVTIYYGFDADETKRITRRSGILGAKGYKTDYPLALWQHRTITSTQELDIAPPLTYDKFKHANCTGCLKGGKQHWYVVFCERPDIWRKAIQTEEEIGYTIIYGTSLIELEPKFQQMKDIGVPATEHIKPQRFWSDVKRKLAKYDQGELIQIFDQDLDTKPCECVI